MTLARQGLDATDEGFHLANQWFFASPRHYSDYSLRIWLTDLLSGGWMRLFPDAPAWGARVGWSASVALCAGLSVCALSPLGGPATACLMSVACALVATAFGVPILNYDSFPVLLLVAAGTLLLSAQRSARAARGWLFAAAGSLLAAAGMSRFPLFLAVPLLVLWSAVGSGLRLSDRSTRDTTWLLCGWLAAGALLLGVLDQLGRLTAWFEYLHALFFEGLADEHHAPTTLAVGYARQATKSLLYAAPAAAGAWSISRARGWRRAGTAAHPDWVLVPVTAAACFGWFWLCGLGAAGVYPFAVAGLTILSGIAATVGALSIVSSADAPWRRQEWAIASAYFVAALSAWLPALGSASGPEKMTAGVWLVLPIAALGFAPLPRALAAAPRALRGSESAAFRGLFLPALLALAALGGVHRFTTPYRDLTDRSRLDTPIDHPKLRGILTSAGRARSFGALLSAVERLAAPGDSILAYDSLGLVHFATGAPAAVRHAWPSVLPAFDLSRRLRELEGRPPRLVVRSRVDMRDPNWGAVRLPPWQATGNNSLLESWVASHGYAPAWSNDEFEVLVRDKDHVESRHR